MPSGPKCPTKNVHQIRAEKRSALREMVSKKRSEEENTAYDVQRWQAADRKADRFRRDHPKSRIVPDDSTTAVATRKQSGRTTRRLLSSFINNNHSKSLSTHPKPQSFAEVENIVKAPLTTGIARFQVYRPKKKAFGWTRDSPRRADDFGLDE